LPNDVVFGTPGAAITTPSTFGVVSSTANTARTLQFAMKLSF
jgi:hypothetical protein